MAENEAVKWYVVHTYSGYENKVKVNLEKAVENNGMQDLIVDVCIPVEEVVEIKNNKRRLVQRKLLPGYVLVKMEMTNESWFVVRNTRGVTGFVGAGNKPTPLSETDFASVFDSVPKTRVDIQVGDNVRILTGLLENFTGRVSSIDSETQKIHVVVPMLRRETDVELAYDEVVRVD
ncbi:MAG: transcription termination/antitermination protein NusG [Christensenellales bacterium]|nr:transcription termination/antitermination protein NusG [Christensenellales bacterium]